MSAGSCEFFDEDGEMGSGFCGCGVTLPYGATECEVCAGAPHHRECPCDECESYWAGVEARSLAAVEAHRRGTTGNGVAVPPASSSDAGRVAAGEPQ